MNFRIDSQTVRRPDHSIDHKASAEKNIHQIKEAIDDFSCTGKVWIDSFRSSDPADFVSGVVVLPLFAAVVAPFVLVTALKDAADAGVHAALQSAGSLFNKA